MRLPVPPSHVNEKGEKTRREPFLPHTQEQVIPEVSALLSPSRDATRFDRVAYYARGAVHIGGIGDNKPKVSVPMAEQPSRRASSMLPVWTDKGSGSS